TIDECSNEMEPYGVPIEWMPMTSTGRRKLNEHKTWIKLQHEREAALQTGQSLAVVECPRPNDILLTKTRRASSHPGNQKLRQVLEERYEERYAAHPMKKQIITNEVADHLEEKLSCRFLVKNKESLWVPAERTTVLDKLGNSFRFVPRLKPKSDEKLPASPDRRVSKPQSAAGVVDQAVKIAAGSKTSDAFKINNSSPPSQSGPDSKKPPTSETREREETKKPTSS
ncbi:MAG: hypothetical protein SGILL_010877, partial [Bacillariaceae sp.]